MKELELQDGRGGIVAIARLDDEGRLSIGRSPKRLTDEPLTLDRGDAITLARWILDEPLDAGS